VDWGEPFDLTLFFSVGKPKYPGIPNEFPYKDQLLPEIAEQRRMVSFGCKKIKLRPVSEQEKCTKEGEVEREGKFRNDLPTLQSVLEKAGVVLEVVDARGPMVFRSEHVEQLAKDAGKKVLLVLNKIGEYSLVLA
jgi:nuclear GTP-binding protein